MIGEYRIGILPQEYTRYVYPVLSLCVGLPLFLWSGNRMCIIGIADTNEKGSCPQHYMYIIYILDVDTKSVLVDNA